MRLPPSDGHFGAISTDMLMVMDGRLMIDKATMKWRYIFVVCIALLVNIYKKIWKVCFIANAQYMWRYLCHRFSACCFPMNPRGRPFVITTNAPTHSDLLARLPSTGSSVVQLYRLVTSFKD